MLPSFNFPCILHRKYSLFNSHPQGQKPLARQLRYQGSRRESVVVSFFSLGVKAMSRDVSFYEPEVSLVDTICRGDSAGVLAELFTSRTRRWPHSYMHIECGTIGTFSDLGRRLPAPLAFDLVPQAIQLVFAQREPELLVTAFSLLCVISGASNTTEMPPSLAANWEQLRALVATLPSNKNIKLEWGWLCRWYRCV